MILIFVFVLRKFNFRPFLGQRIALSMTDTLIIVPEKQLKIKYKINVLPA